MSSPVIPSAVVFGARPGGIGAALAARLPGATGVRALALVARTAKSVRNSAAHLDRTGEGLATLALTADLGSEAAADDVVETLGRARVSGSGASYLEGLRIVVFAAGTVIRDEGEADELCNMHAIKERVAPVLIRRLAESMARRPSDRPGSIILVGSLTALIPVPSLAEYGASNVRLLELAQSLGSLRQQGVCCTYSAPAWVKTDTLRCLLDADLQNPLARQWIWGAADSADAIAEDTLAAALAGERLVIPGRNGKLLHQQYRLARSFGVEPLYRLVQEVGARWSGFR